MNVTLLSNRGVIAVRVVVGAAILRDGTLLAQQRAYPESVAGQWELPGGGVEPGETDRAALRRECLEELGVRVTVGDQVGPDVPVRDGLVLRVYRADLDPPDTTPHPHDHHALRWLTAATLDTVDWLPADRALLPALRQLLTSAAQPVPWPDDLPIVERSAVRLVVLDARDTLLLFHTRDVDHPDLGTWWELPGGGIDPGETYLDAAIRELREETGIVADRSQVGPPTWRRRASFRHRQTRHVQAEVIVALRLPHAGPGVDESRRLDYEREDYFDFRWWPIPEILSSGDRFYPGQLPALLGAFLNGEEIDEPFELWS